MLNEGLASWSDMEAITCWGKPKQIIMHIKDVVEEYILYIVAYTNTTFLIHNSNTGLILDCFTFTVQWRQKINKIQLQTAEYSQFTHFLNMLAIFWLSF